MIKVGDKYLAKEGAAGANFHCDTGQLVTITENNIEVCESLVYAGILVEAEIKEVPAEQNATYGLPAASKPIVVEKKRQPRKTHQE